MRRFTLIVAACVLVAGCTNKITSTMEIDGKPFKPDSCRSLQPMGNVGVELEVEYGSKIRVVERVDGGADVLFFKNGATKGKNLGECADFTIGKQNSSVNKVTNVEGKATFDCKKKDIEVTGTVTFANCH